METIEDEAFMESTAQAVILPSTCTSIGHLAFAHCPNLIYIEIPASCTSIAEDAFFNSPNVFIYHID
ncbi:MAG: leucine-rich repeat protein [Clostridia bacterium]|nr:leucine-rich repeat protein [Clostridia bacterium]